MSLDYAPELMRQHREHLARRARLNMVPPPKKAEPIVVQRTYPPLKKWSVEKPVSCESLWLDWLAQRHLAAGYEPIDAEPAIGLICLEVRKQFGVGKMDFLSARRQREFVVPRQVAMALAKHLTRKSLPEIGSKLGGRDHTTILHGCRKMQPVTDAVASKLSADASVSEWVSAMKAEVLVTSCARPAKYTRKALDPAI